MAIVLSGPLKMGPWQGNHSFMSCTMTARSFGARLMNHHFQATLVITRRPKSEQMRT